MHYLVQKFDHECLIEDVFEGNTFEESIANAYKNIEDRMYVIMGCEIPEDEGETFGTPESMIEWIKENNYEFTRIYESETPFKSFMWLG